MINTKFLITPIFLSFLGIVLPLIGLIKNYELYNNVITILYLHFVSFLSFCFGTLLQKQFNNKIFQSNIINFYKYGKLLIIIQLLVIIYIIQEINSIPIFSGINNDELYERLSILIPGTLLLLLLLNQLISIFYIHKFMLNKNLNTCLIIFIQIFSSTLLFKRQILAAMLCSFIFIYLYKIRFLKLRNIILILFYTIIFLLFFEFINSYRISKLEELSFSFENSSIIHYFFMPLNNFDIILSEYNFVIYRYSIFIEKSIFNELVNDVFHKGVSFGFIAYCYIFGGYLFLFFTFVIIGYLFQSLYYSLSINNYASIVYSFSIWPLLSMHSYTHFFSLYYFYFFICIVFIFNHLGKNEERSYIW
jgi:oligosaccharide repeat unit polymerase